MHEMYEVMLALSRRRVQTSTKQALGERERERDLSCCPLIEVVQLKNNGFSYPSRIQKITKIFSVVGPSSTFP